MHTHTHTHAHKSTTRQYTPGIGPQVLRGYMQCEAPPGPQKVHNSKQGTCMILYSMLILHEKVVEGSNATRLYTHHQSHSIDVDDCKIWCCCC